MKPLNFDEVRSYVMQQKIAFDQAILPKLKTLSLERLSLHNPYYLMTKRKYTIEAFVVNLIDSYLSPLDERFFDDLLVGLAFTVSQQTCNANKSVIQGIDLEFINRGTYYIVAIRPSHLWGNAEQIARMKTNFKAAKILLRSNGETRPIIAVNGCMYGTDNSPYKPDPTDPEMSYFKYCGEVFWEFISGDSHLYLDLIQPLEAEASKRSPEFDELYIRRVNQMALEFGNEFVTKGQIDWEKLVRFVSAKSSLSLQTPLTN